MDSSAAATSTNALAQSIGYWLWGFVSTMAVGYILLKFAGSPGRKPGTAIALRALAVLAAAFLTYAGYVGGGGRLNLGSVIGLLIVTTWAIRQQFRRKAR